LVLEEICSIWPDADVDLLDDQPDWAELPNGALVVLDEIWKYFPSGQKQKGADQGAVELLRMHRHRVGDVAGRQLSQEIVLINQGKQFAAWIKELVDKTYVLRKLDAIGADRRFRLDIYQGYQDTDRPFKRDHIRGYVGTYKPEVYSLYRSHTQANVDVVDPEELKADKKATVWSGSGMKVAIAGPFVAAFAIWYALSHIGEFLGAETQAASPKPAEETRLAAPTAPAASDLARISEWRLVGSMQYLEGAHVGRWSILLARGRDRRYLHDIPCETRHGELYCTVDGLEVSGHTGTRADVWSVVDPGAPTG